MLKSINTGFFLSLSLLIAATSCATASASSYDAARERFKERLCNKQGDLMNRSAYLQFIEPHLQKAEAKLAIPQHLQTKTALNYRDESYMKELADCNVALFHSYVKPNSNLAEVGYEQCKRNLKRAIVSIKISDDVKVDVDAEFNKTAKILTAANEEFYKKLSGGNKTLLWLIL